MDDDYLKIVRENEENTNAPSDHYKDMSFKVPLEFHRKFRQVATGHDLPLKVLLEKSLGCFVSINGVGKQLNKGDFEKKS